MALALAATWAHAQDARFTAAAVPLTSYSSDVGLGFGARGIAKRLAEGYAPYQASLEAQAFATTGGVQFHFLSLDLPRLLGSPYRVELLAGYRRDVAAPYYGIGNATRPDPAAASTLYTYDEESALARARVRRTLVGPLSVLLGYRFIAQAVRAKPGSLLARDAPFGSGGGRYGELALGLAYDTRDDELAPNRGVLLEAAARATAAALGSEGSSAGFFLSASAYRELAHGLVLAARVAGDGTVGEVPFDRLGDFGSLVTPFFLVEGVGGALTVRGLMQSEYVGRAKAIGNLELRYRIFDTTVFGHAFGLGAVAFVDAGRVFNPGEPLASGGVHLGGRGAGCASSSASRCC